MRASRNHTLEIQVVRRRRQATVYLVKNMKRRLGQACCFTPDLQDYYRVRSSLKQTALPFPSAGACITIVLRSRYTLNDPKQPPAASLRFVQSTKQGHVNHPLVSRGTKQSDVYTHPIKTTIIPHHCRNYPAYEASVRKPPP